MTWVLNSKIHSKAVSDFVANTIELAADLAPAKWGLTEYPAGGLRLNVGFCEVLTTRLSEFRILLDASVPSGLENDSRFSFEGTASDPFYPSAQRSQLLTVPYLEATEMDAVLAGCRASHEAIVATAANRGFNNGAKRGHSNQAVDALSEFSGRELPYPDYAANAASRSAVRPLPEEISPTYSEGSAKRVFVNRYERAQSARRRCLEVYGAVCHICRVDLATIYGPSAAGLVHVHHVVPLAEVGESYEVDPERDLIPVCPNCHAVVHLRRANPFTVLEVREMIDRTARSTAQNPATPAHSAMPLRGSAGR